MFRSSPSGIGLMELCEARGVAKYVWGYDEPETPAMSEGTRNHRIVQTYLREGVVPAASEVAARKMIEVLPIGAGSIAPSDIERLVLLENHHGYIDWRLGRIHGDLKFTKSVRYQKEKDPTKDPQRIIYAVDAFALDSRMQTLRQTWAVSQFDGTKALTLVHEWSHVTAHKAYDKIVRPVHDRLEKAIATNLHWQDAPKNQASCDLYPPNGCIMKKHGCRRSLQQRLLAIRPKGQNEKRTG